MARLAEVGVGLGEQEGVSEIESEPAELLTTPHLDDVELGFHQLEGFVDQNTRHVVVTVGARGRLRGDPEGHKVNVPRAIWSGTIGFGLVSVPVRMYTAVSEHKLHFSLLHRKDDSPIGYEKVCKKESKPVPDDEIVKAYEIEKGGYVYVEDEDFEAARAEGGHAFDIHQFVAIEEIDPIYFEHTYYLAPQDGAEKVYTLLVRAMEDAGLAAIGTFVMREREHLGCLRIVDGVIVLERMYFADEIRPAKELKPARAQVRKEELEMATSLIDRFKGSFDPKAYSDTYTDRLLDVIRRKRRGEEIHVAKEPEPTETPDLMEALRASLEASKQAKRKAPSRRKAPAARRSAGSRRSSRSTSRR